jgi:hypothetical protein
LRQFGAAATRRSTTHNAALTFVLLGEAAGGRDEHKQRCNDGAHGENGGLGASPGTFIWKPEYPLKGTCGTPFLHPRIGFHFDDTRFIALESVEEWLSRAAAQQVGAADAR